MKYSHVFDGRRRFEWRGWLNLNNRVRVAGGLNRIKLWGGSR